MPAVARVGQVEAFEQLVQIHSGRVKAQRGVGAVFSRWGLRRGKLTGAQQLTIERVTSTERGTFSGGTRIPPGPRKLVVGPL